MKQCTVNAPQQFTCMHMSEVLWTPSSEGEGTVSVHQLLLEATLLLDAYCAAMLIYIYVADLSRALSN